MRKPVWYICELCEILTVELIQRIEEAHEKFKIVGIGIYSDNLFVALNGRKPIKKYADRAKLVSALKGVDFVFELDESTDLDSELNICSDSSTGISLNKPYHVGYAPGTYNLFHEGHLEHLTEAKFYRERSGSDEAQKLNFLSQSDRKIKLKLNRLGHKEIKLLFFLFMSILFIYLFILLC